MMSDQWPFLAAIIIGWLATDIWRWLGVLVGNRLGQDSEALHFVRAIATSLVMAVTAKLVVFPTGALAATPLWLRLLATCLGFAALLASGRRVIVGVVVALMVLACGMWLNPPVLP